MTFTQMIDKMVKYIETHGSNAEWRGTFLTLYDKPYPELKCLVIENRILGVTATTLDLSYVDENDMVDSALTIHIANVLPYVVAEETGRLGKPTPITSSERLVEKTIELFFRHFSSRV